MGNWGRVGALLLLAVISLGAGAVPGAPAHATTSTSTSTSATNAATPVVHGNRLIDSSTNTVFVPHGVNWPSFEYACWQGWGYSSSTSSAQAAIMASWRINTVRLPLNQDCWLGLQGSPAGSGRTASGYRAAVHSWVSTLNAAGLVVILDLHSSAPAGYPAHGQRAMPDSQSVTFWSSVAAEFASSPSVLFDLFNEPYSRWNDASSSWTFDLTWDCWSSGGCQAPVEDDYTAVLSGAKFTAVGMQSLVSAMRNAGAAQPLLLGGLDYANDLRQWLASRPADNQLVASWHNYPGQRCHTIACWNSEIAPVAAVVPVVAGEFGQTDGGSGFLTTFMDWADVNGVGYLPWAWWQVDASESLTNSRYALIDDALAPKAPSGTAYYDHLAALPPPAPAISVSRVAGTDRYATAVAISQRAFPDSAPIVYIASGVTFADSLSAGPAASAQGGPLLLTSPDSLPAIVRHEVERLSPATIVIVGGESAVSAAVAAELASIQPSVVRLGGADRYETSRLIVGYAFANSTEVYLATGRDFPDALGASAAAAQTRSAVVLVDGLAGSLDPAIERLIRSLSPETVLIVGGLSAIGLALQDDVATLAPSTERLSGADRYATSLAIAQWGRARADSVLLATGVAFPDALAASVWAGQLAAPLIVVPPTCVPAATRAALSDLGVASATLIGGTSSLSEGVATLRVC